jgi:hypothetical protein
MDGEMSCRLTCLYLRLTDQEYGGGRGDENEEEYVIMMVFCIVKGFVVRI